MTPRTPRAPLRAVAKDEKPPAPRKRPTNLREAAESTERDLLVTIRTKLATTIDAGVPDHALAPLVRQLRDIDSEIRLIDEKAEQEAAEDAAVSERRTWNPEAI